MYIYVQKKSSSAIHHPGVPVCASTTGHHHFIKYSHRFTFSDGPVKPDRFSKYNFVEFFQQQWGHESHGPRLANPLLEFLSGAGNDDKPYRLFHQHNGSFESLYRRHHPDLVVYSNHIQWIGDL